MTTADIARRISEQIAAIRAEQKRLQAARVALTTVRPRRGRPRKAVS